VNDLNCVTLIGRLTRDADLKYTASGTAVSKFSIAVNRNVKKGDNWETEASFFDIVLWGRQAESLDKYLLKGKQVGVMGELRQDRWEQEGKSRSKVEVVADTIQLLGRGSEARSSSSEHGNDSKPSSSQKSSPQGTRENDDGFTDDIPF
jgi:single-strand DNA-binding protein